MVTIPPVALLIQACGLSQREAAAYLGCSVASVKKWALELRRPPDRAVADLRKLYRKIARTADLTSQLVEHRIKLAIKCGDITGAPGPSIVLGMAADDAEAQALGWPCQAAQAAALGRVIARHDANFVIRLERRETNTAQDAHTGAASDP